VKIRNGKKRKSKREWEVLLQAKEREVSRGEGCKGESR